MKKWILLVSLFISCQEDKPDPFDETLPLINIDKIRIVESGGGFGVPPTYSLSFSGEIINQTENVFKTYRQNVKFTALNGNQVNGQMTRCPCFDGYVHTIHYTAAAKQIILRKALLIQ